MEQEIRIIVRVSNREHAEAIREDILGVLRLRTPIAYIGEPRTPERSIEQAYAEDRDKV